MNVHIKILILNWNKAFLTEQCLNSLKNLKYDNFSTLVIDNASTDNSVSMIRNKFPDVELLVLDKNYGFARGYNLAIKYLKKKYNDFVLILNNDTIVDPNLLNELTNELEKYGKSNFYCPIIHYLDNQDIIWYAGGNVNLRLGQLSHNSIREKNIGQFSKTFITDYATGCCILTSVKTFEDLNGFDNNFNMYGEDVDLCLRANLKGIKSYVVPNARIYHMVSASIGGEFSIKKLLKKLKSIKMLMHKHCTISEFLIGYPLFIFRMVVFFVRKSF